uniref:U exon n=1 Tax=Zoothera dauma adenovirus TaxID=3073259 RepID=A0AA51NPQ7_9ADEN|nr:U exon [Zoothera dauma adenovirus]
MTTFYLNGILLFKSELILPHSKWGSIGRKHGMAMENYVTEVRFTGDENKRQELK